MEQNGLKDLEKPAAPPGGKRRKIVLTKMHHVRAELARLYSEARNGEITTSDASKLGNLLSILAKIIEGHDLENRILELERISASTGERG